MANDSPFERPKQIPEGKDGGIYSILEASSFEMLYGPRTVSRVAGAVWFTDYGMFLSSACLASSQEGPGNHEAEMLFEILPCDLSDSLQTDRLLVEFRLLFC